MAVDEEKKFKQTQSARDRVCKQEYSKRNNLIEKLISYTVKELFITF